MKKIMIAAVAATSIVAFAGQAQATESSVVGYQSITINPGFNLISLNFEPIAGESVDIQDLIADKTVLVAGTGAANSDQIQIWDGTKFTTYFYRAYKSQNPGKFTLGPCWVDGTSTATAAQPAVKQIGRGMGVWFARPATADAGVITLTGAVGSSAQNIQINKGFNMIGSAFPVDITVNSETCPINWSKCAVAGGAAATSDQIQIWDGTKFTTYFYRAYKSSNPGKFTLGPCWVDGTSTATAASPTTLTIPAGVGFWYARPNSAEAGNLQQASPVAD